MRTLFLVSLLIASTARADTQPLEFETLHPDELEHVLQKTPVAFVPIGALEHHGWHLPVGFDAIKSHALCQRIAERTGGVVLPPFFYGTGGAHAQFKWSIIAPENQIRPLLEATLDHLSRFGFKVVVMLTGHYAGEQVEMVRQLAQEAGARNTTTRYIGLAEPQVSTPTDEDAFAGDHAAKYETSIALALNPSWVKTELLTQGRDAEQVTLPSTPRDSSPSYDPASRFYAIMGGNVEQASAALGRRLVSEITDRLAQQVGEVLAQTR